MDCMTLQHIGTFLLFTGTLALAFAVTSEGQYEERYFREIEAKNRDKQLFSPTRIRRNPWLFWGGLLFNAIGALLTWE